MPTTEEKEECISCSLAVLGGITLNICRELDKPELNCEELTTKFIEGQVSLQELVEVIRKNTADPNILGRLEEIELLAKGDRNE